MTNDSVTVQLWSDIKNLVLAHKLYPVEGYEFPQDSVADFWKSLFIEKGLTVFGAQEIPENVKVLQTDFVLPDEPPEWLYEREE